MSSVFNKNSSNFEELLELDEFVSVHTRNLQTLATKLFKVSKYIAPKILKDIFSLSLNTEYNLRHQSHNQSVSFIGPKIWDIVPSEITEKESLAAFKNAIKIWKSNNCPCRLCKKYIAGIGFI